MTRDPGFLGHVLGVIADIGPMRAAPVVGGMPDQSLSAAQQKQTPKAQRKS